ncbi:unannotated protein [freshwater metagenome]|uniref:Unannotated protein n=1 Tax=freshwater metagenome TaxID=449393 RepID=A0A6J6XZV0_9ZZZZ
MGSTTALPIDEPDRAMVSTTTPIASPVMPLNRPHTRAPMMASGMRFDRSAYWAIGTCNASAAIDASATRASAVVRLMLNSSRMFGSKMPNAVRSSSSTALSPKRMTSGKADSPPQMVRSHTIGCLSPSRNALIMPVPRSCLAVLSESLLHSLLLLRRAVRLHRDAPWRTSRAGHATWSPGCRARRASPTE